MLKNLTCVQCHILTSKLFEDPRPEPIDEYECLCERCLEFAHEELADEEETTVDKRA